MKRVIDIVVAGVSIVLLAPLLFILAISVWVFLGWPVFFIHQRPGLHCKPFKLLKFRTMRNATDSAGVLLSDRQRLTWLGRVLRVTSMDELPELWNVFVGDMSLVGPRPLLMEYLPLYTSEQIRRHNVQPGITGWAQVNGRNALSWEDKFKLDVWYVDHHSLWLDTRIMLRTIAKVVKCEGISAPGDATMPVFHGTAGSDRKV